MQQCSTANYIYPRNIAIYFVGKQPHIVHFVIPKFSEKDKMKGGILIICWLCFGHCLGINLICHSFHVIISPPQLFKLQIN